MKITILSAQQAVVDADNLYDSDPLLFNGKQYSFFIPVSTGGHQFFSEPQFVTGSVTIRGVTYTDLTLNYDIYNQQLVLQYINSLGAKNQIVLSEAWLESFRLKEIDFELISTQDSLKQIFQVIGTGQYYILYKWKKDLVMDGFIGSKNHTFTIPRKEMKLYSDNLITQYTNNKTFYSLFVPGKKERIIEYIRINKINVKKSADSTVNRLVNYINSLSSK
ncbi:MAG TPA: hypothetical protein VMV47_08010 [Bacteroidales bacterium]|nr:hypothetical protein [Bacteroidales bacterium]